MKKCTQCKKSLPLESFTKHCRAKDGLTQKCKKCSSVISKRYRDNHKKEISLRDKLYKNKNKAKVKAQSNVYRSKNRERLAAASKKRYDSATPEEVLERSRKKRAYTQNVPESVKQRKREYDKKYFSSQRGKEVTSLSIRKRRAQKLSSEDGTITHQTLAKLMDDQDSKCSYCSTALDLQPKGDVHLDHVVPLSKGGIHSINNVVWSCASCNHKKSNRLL